MPVVSVTSHFFIPNFPTHFSLINLTWDLSILSFPRTPLGFVEPFYYVIKYLITAFIIFIPFLQLILWILCWVIFFLKFLRWMFSLLIFILFFFPDKKLKLYSSLQDCFGRTLQIFICSVFVTQIIFWFSLLILWLTVT